MIKTWKTKEGKEILASIKAERVPTGLKVTVYGPRLAAAMQAFCTGVGYTYRPRNGLQIMTGPGVSGPALTLQSIDQLILCEEALAGPVTLILPIVELRAAIEAAVEAARDKLKRALQQHLVMLSVEMTLVATDVLPASLPVAGEGAL